MLQLGLLERLVGPLELAGSANERRRDIRGAIREVQRADPGLDRVGRRDLRRHVGRELRWSGRRLRAPCRRRHRDCRGQCEEHQDFRVCSHESSINHVEQLVLIVTYNRLYSLKLHAQIMGICSDMRSIQAQVGTPWRPVLSPIRTWAIP